MADDQQHYFESGVRKQPKQVDIKRWTRKQDGGVSIQNQRKVIHADRYIDKITIDGNNYVPIHKEMREQ